MQKQVKKLCAFLLAVVMLIGQFSIPSNAANTFYLDFLSPSAGIASTKGNFGVLMADVDMSSLYTTDDIRFYMLSESVGTNWKIDEATDASNLTQGTSVGNVARVFPMDDGNHYVAMYRLNKPLVLSFTAPAEGYYTLTGEAHLHVKGGYAAIYVNDEYVGRIDTYLDKGVKKQPLLSVYLKEGENANTITIKPVGKSSGAEAKVFVNGFHFEGALSIQKLIGLNATVEHNNMYIGRKETISVEGITTNNTDYDFASAGETITYSSSNKSVATVSTSGVITAVGAGAATITVTTSETGYTDTIEVSVRNATFDSVDFNVAEGQAFNMSGSVELKATPYMSDGTLVLEDDYSVTYTSSNTSVASIDGNVLSLLETGTASITATVTFNPTGAVKTVTRNISVKNISLTSIQAQTEKAVVQALDTNGVQLNVIGYSGDEEVGDLAATGFGISDFSYESLNPEIIAIDENGICKYVSRGVAEVKVTLNSNTDINCVAEVVSSSSKTGRTLFTDEKVATAKSNIAKYSWASTLNNTAVKNSSYYMQYLDALYDLIPAEGVPRSSNLGTEKGTYAMLNCCPYCGANFTKGEAKCNTDLINYPWKVQCSACLGRFPSNDFALLYERGLDENGNYDVQLAYANNAAAVARGEKDALVNELYPDKGATWMVDDGFGWSPVSGTYGTKDLPKWTPVARANNLFWYNAEKYDFTKILNYLKNAYMWTGNEDYGRAGAILLDRVADVYPDYDHTKVSLAYAASHGGGYSGKIYGGIWEHYLAEYFIECYDAFYPMYDDEEVINYLSAKAAKLGLDNPKTTPDLIRENIENGILRESADALYSADIYGNFGMQQKIAAKAAVVLDVERESEELLEWLMKPSVVKKERVFDSVYSMYYDSRYSNSGGELATKYASEFDRDGFGGEVSLTYNKIWYQQSVEIAEILALYSEKYDLYNNPRFVKMFDSFMHLTLGDGYSLALGDGGSTAHAGITSFANETLIGYSHLKDPYLAQTYYRYVGGDLTNKYIDIYSDPAELMSSIEADIATYGELKQVSENLTGYGLAVLRGGDNGKSYETRYDTWMYYGRSAESHAHYDMLSAGISAYGFNFMPDLGYPEDTGKNANRYEWVKHTISHNTVLVNNDHQNGLHTGEPLHFDSTDYVKLIDTEAPGAYDEADIYRRTLISVAVDEDVSYTLDLFRIKGGDSHTYSFHTQSYSDYANNDLAFSSSDITFTAQKDSSGNYVGTYAGADVAYGPDPNSTDTIYSEETVYPRGYTWLTEVNRGVDKSGDGNFVINFEQTDFRGQVEDSEGLNLKFRALNTWTPDSIDVMTGYPPRKSSNSAIPGLHYMLIQRTGTDLDTLFTSIWEPYKGTAYIKDAKNLVPTIKSGNESADDVVKVVKVTLTSGRTDYIVYATNNAICYTVTDGNVSFDFKGFVGVYSVNASGKNIYCYVNDGTKMGDSSGTGTYTGTIVDFTKTFGFENTITIKPDQTVSDVSVLENQYIYVDDTSANTGVFRIEKAQQSGDNIILDLGIISLVEGYVDPYDVDSGYLYTIEAGQSFEIPVSISTGALY